MYISRPSISPNVTKQLAKKPSVPIHRGSGNSTTVMVADDALRHPVTQKFQARWQNKQTPQGPSVETRVGQDKGSLPKKSY